MFTALRQRLSGLRTPISPMVTLSALLSIVLFGTLLFTTIITAPANSWANGLQANQFEEQPATLVGPRADAAIALYIRPAPNQQPVGYGMSGDPVTITDQFGDYLMEDDPSATWSHIRLEKPPYTEGWLRGRFLSTEQSGSIEQSENTPSQD